MLQPLGHSAVSTNGAGTEAIIVLTKRTCRGSLDHECRHAAKRHFSTRPRRHRGRPAQAGRRTETMLAAVRAAGRIPVPGRKRRADLLDTVLMALAACRPWHRP